MILRVREEHVGKHIRCRLFMGPDEGPIALLGILHMDVQEWYPLHTALMVGSKSVPSFEVQFPDEETVILSVNEKALAAQADKAWADKVKENDLKSMHETKDKK